MTLAPKYVTTTISNKEKLASTIDFASDGSGFTKRTVKIMPKEMLVTA